MYCTGSIVYHTLAASSRHTDIAAGVPLLFCTPSAAASRCCSCTRRPGVTRAGGHLQVAGAGACRPCGCRQHAQAVPLCCIIGCTMLTHLPPCRCCWCCGCFLSPSAAVAPADQVSPEQVVTYKWLVPERAGPGPADAGSIMWMYHSHVDEAADPAAGLMGAIIIMAPSNANDDATPKDVSRCAHICLEMWHVKAQPRAESVVCSNSLPRMCAW